MDRFIRKMFSLCLLLLSVSYVLAAENSIRDIIPPIKLIAGRLDTILMSDLFYLDDYDVGFLPGKDIKATFNRDNLLLLLESRPDFEGISNIQLTHAGKIYTIPVYVKKIGQRTFSFKPDKKCRAVNLFGSFNNWNRTELPMKETDGGKYEITIPLEPGRYEYKFFVDGEEILDPQNRDVVANDIGGRNSVMIIPELHSEKIFLHKSTFKKKSSNSEFQFYLEAEKKLKLSKAHLIVLLDNQRIENKGITIKGRVVTVVLSNDDLSSAKMLRVAVSNNGLNSNMQMVPLSGGVPAGDQSDFNWYDGIIYSLITDRFYDGDKTNDSPIKHDSLSEKANYMGGDFAGITQKIIEGYFDSLGVNAIWISPVNDNPDSAFREYPAPHRWYTGYHGYWPIQAEKVEEKFGTFDELKSLIKTAHRHKIKVLLDFVSHHVHQEHTFFKEHKDWFGKLKLPDGRLNLRLWDEQRLTTWFEPYLPSFDFVSSDEAVNAMTDNAIWWLKQTGADGFRHDAVKHVPNRFWRTLTRKLKKEIERQTGSLVYQIGETFGNYDLVSSYVNNGQLSAQFNFELYNTAQAAFIDPQRSFRDLDLEMKKTLDVYGSLLLMGNIMDSHDKNRYMAYTDGDLDLSQWSAIEQGWNNPPQVDNPTSYEKAELYYAYMLSIPGIPVVYYGSEFGMTGASDPDNRRMMRFDDQLNENEKRMLEVVSRIIGLREKNSALRYGDFYSLQSDEKIFAYCRSDFEQRIVIALNKSEETQTVALTLPAFYSTRKAINLVDQSSYKVVDGKLAVSLKPRGWAMIRLDPK
jgi:cyclomaltodextrinase